MSAPIAPNAPQQPNPQAQAQGAPAAPVAEPSLADVVAGLNQLAQAVQAMDGRTSKLGQDLGALRAKVKADAPAGPADTGNASNAPRALTAADLTAAMQLGQVSAKLPAPAQQRVNALIEQGRSHAEALSFAQALEESLASLSQQLGGVTPPSQANGVMPRPAPIGTSAMPAHNLATTYPTTVAELLRLKATNPKGYEAVMADPNFDSSELPQR